MKLQFQQKVNILNTIISLNLKRCYILPISLKLRFEDINLNKKDFYCRYNSTLVMEDGSDSIDKENLQLLLKEITRKGWDYVLFKSIKEMTFVSEDNFAILTGNYEKIKNDTDRYTIRNEKGLTLKDWVEGIYRCKICLHNYWNELFYPLDLKKGDKEIKPFFDYGS